jgi:hypothetical protein
MARLGPGHVRLARQTPQIAFGASGVGNASQFLLQRALCFHARRQKPTNPVVATRSGGMGSGEKKKNRNQDSKNAPSRHIGHSRPRNKALILH